MRYIYYLLFIILPFISFEQGSSCLTPINIGTPSSTQVCTTYSTAGTGSSPCTGSGYGGGGSVSYVQFCTNASNDCVNFTISDGTTSGNWAVTIYATGCSPFIDAQCLGNTGTGSSFNTSASGLAASTCYTARIWIKNGGTFNLCSETLAPPNDNCSGATAIDGTPLAADNYCDTPGPTTNTPTITPSDLCAGTLENTAWYTFTTLATADVVITIANISCSGGGAGFQIGYFSGTCGTLSNLGCSSGSGGTVTTTITGLSAGDIVTVAIDGNAGANCTFDISATNTVVVPLPVELENFNAKYVPENRNIEISWITVTEFNNDYFTIEKTTDGITFEVVGIVDGNGNTQMVSDYGMIDTNPTKGTSYYRLAQTDFDGEVVYSKSVVVIVESSFGDLRIFPNPVSENSYMSYVSDVKEETTLNIIDVSGSVISSKTIYSEIGNNEVDLETSELNKGVYFVRISNSKETQVAKFVKK